MADDDTVLFVERKASISAVTASVTASAIVVIFMFAGVAIVVLSDVLPLANVASNWDTALAPVKLLRTSVAFDKASVAFESGASVVDVMFELNGGYELL